MVTGENSLSWLYRLLILLSIIPIQSIFLEKLRIAGVKPDLALVFVFIQGWVRGEKAGLYWGLAMGGLSDFFSIGVLGVAFALKGAVGYVSGLLGGSMLHLSLQAYGLIFLIFSILHDFAGHFFLHGLSMEGLQSAHAEDILLRALYNTLLSLVGILFFGGRLEKGGLGDGRFSPGKQTGA